MNGKYVKFLARSLTNTITSEGGLSELRKFTTSKISYLYQNSKNFQSRNSRGGTVQRFSKDYHPTIKLQKTWSSSG